jgi:hypothetical protein
MKGGSDGDTLTTPGATVGRCSVVTRGRRPIRKFKTKSPRPISRRGLNSCDDGYKPVICPTSQVFKTNRLSFELSSAEGTGRKRLGKVASKENLPETKKPAGPFGPRANFSDDEHMKVICPSSQVLKTPMLATDTRSLFTRRRPRKFDQMKKPAAFASHGLISPTVGICR